MQTALLHILGTWIGRQATERAFETRGFSVHRIWQHRMAEFCGPGAAQLDRYWNEVARETMCNAGKSDPNTRKFLVNPSYRSSYLDELAARMVVEAPFRAPPLVECLFEYVKKCFRDHEFVMDETVFFEGAKEGEAERLSISAQGWGGRKRDVLRFAEEFGASLGFAARRNHFAKASPAGLAFEFKVDLAGYPNCGRGLPLQFQIHHPDDAKFIYDVNFDRLVPGFSRYAYCEMPRSYVLGIRAHIEFFNVLLDCFGGVAPNSLT
jgi:hypothetical protein